MKKTERQGGAERRQGKAGGASAGEKRTERQPEKSRRSVGREKQANSRQRKAGGASAGKASGVSAREKRRSVGRRKADKPSARKQAAEAKKPQDVSCGFSAFPDSGRNARRSVGLLDIPDEGPRALQFGGGVHFTEGRHQRRDLYDLFGKRLYSVKPETPEIGKYV